MLQHRFAKEDLADSTGWWQDRLRASLAELPSDWTKRLLGRFAPGEAPPTLPLAPRTVGELR